MKREIAGGHRSRFEKLLDNAAKRLRDLWQDKFMMTETPLEVQDGMEIAAEDIGTAIKQIRSCSPKKRFRQRCIIAAPVRDYPFRAALFERRFGIAGR